eukprot:gene13597-19470_t
MNSAMRAPSASRIVAPVTPAKTLRLASISLRAAPRTCISVVAAASLETMGMDVEMVDLAAYMKVSAPLATPISEETHLDTAPEPRYVHRISHAVQQRLKDLLKLRLRSSLCIRASRPLVEPHCTTCGLRIGLLPSSSKDWDDWFLADLSRQLVGVECGTSRVKVLTGHVESAIVSRNSTGVDDVDVYLSVEAAHRKAMDTSVIGVARLKLCKDADGRDTLKVLSLKMDTNEAAMEYQHKKDIEFAVLQTLGSALLVSLNEFLWNAENRSHVLA